MHRKMCTVHIFLGIAFERDLYNILFYVNASSFRNKRIVF